MLMVVIKMVMVVMKMVMVMMVAINMVMMKMVMMVSTVSWFGISLISTLAVPSILIDFPTICNDFHILTNLYFKPVRGSFP